MAIAQGNFYITPSVDVKTNEELDTLEVEAGLFHTNESRTIKDLTINKWTVTCLSTEVRESIRCHTQIWVPATGATENVRMFVRTAAPGNSVTTYTDFVEMITENALAAKTVLNETGKTVKLQLGGAQPTPAEGEEYLWVT